MSGPGRAAATFDRRPAAWIAERGEEVLGLTLPAGSTDPAPLAGRIVAIAGAEPFAAPLRAGLTALLTAVRRRSPVLANAAACRLVGVGPGRTPLGDDYLAASALTVARLGEEAGFDAETRTEWLAAALPRRLLELTTPISAQLLFDAFRGVAPEPVAGVLEPGLDRAGLRAAVARATAVGATSGPAWSAAIGATAVLLGNA